MKQWALGDAGAGSLNLELNRTVSKRLIGWYFLHSFGFISCRPARVLLPNQNFEHHYINTEMHMSHLICFNSILNGGTWNGVVSKWRRFLQQLEVLFKAQLCTIYYALTERILFLRISKVAILYTVYLSS